jgi:hypothetical protein
MAMTGKTNTGLVEFCKQVLNDKCGYVYGTYGQVCTLSLLEQQKQRFPDNNLADGPMFEAGKQWIGKRVMDCSGLIKYYLASNKYGEDPKITTAIDQCVNYDKASEKGAIGSMPELPGVLVGMPGHVGVYIGNGEVIEAQGTQYGVKKTKFSGRGWTKWWKLPEISYTTNSNITLDTSTYTFNSIGQVYRVLAKCNNKPTVTSSNTNVVSVTYAGSDSRGYLFDLTAKSQGLVTITATLNGKSATMRASLGCSLDTSSYTFKVGAKYTFLAKCINKPTISFSTAGIVQIVSQSQDSRGHLFTMQAQKAGKTNVTATLGTFKNSFPVTVTA